MGCWLVVLTILCMVCGFIGLLPSSLCVWYVGLSLGYIVHSVCGAWNCLLVFLFTWFMVCGFVAWISCSFCVWYVGLLVGYIVHSFRGTWICWLVLLIVLSMVCRYIGRLSCYSGLCLTTVCNPPRRRVNARKTEIGNLFF